MARYLVIVESPAKVKTIKKFLGSNYVVTASNGHVRDLPKSQLGVDVEHDYEPKYITIRGKGEILANLRKEVKKADKVYLATDPDREGEAISWHLSQALKLENKKTYRISFNEITKNAVKASLKNAREIDMDLVDAQQARRVLDRIVGYRISPLLWAKVKSCLLYTSRPQGKYADCGADGNRYQRKPFGQKEKYRDTDDGDGNLKIRNKKIHAQLSRQYDEQAEKEDFPHCFFHDIPQSTIIFYT